MVDHPPADRRTGRTDEGVSDAAIPRSVDARAIRTTRRRILAAGATVTASAVAGCFVSTSGTGSLGLYAAATDDGSEQWTMDLPDLEASPTLLGDTLYVGIGSSVRAHSPADGSELWSTDLELPGFPDFSRPTVGGDTVLVPADEELIALSASSGSVQWRFDAGDTVWIDPPVADGTVVAGAGESDVYGVALSDGSQQWQFSGQELAENSAAVAGDTVVVNSRAGRVHGLALADGGERWAYATEDPAAGRPAVGGGAAYVGTTGRRVHAVSTADGSGRWSADTSGGAGNVAAGSGHYPEPRFVDGTVYAEDNDVLYVADADGRNRWAFGADSDLSSDLGYAVTGGTTYVGVTRTESGGGEQASMSHYPTVYALDGGGSEQWVTEIDGRGVESPPGVGNDAVYVGLQEGSVHALARADGSERWTYEPGVLEQRPAVVGDTVILAATS